jgi:hypothetical protein
MREIVQMNKVVMYAFMLSCSICTRWGEEQRRNKMLVGSTGGKMAAVQVTHPELFDFSKRYLIANI